MVVLARLAVSRMYVLVRHLRYYRFRVSLGRFYRFWEVFLGSGYEVSLLHVTLVHTLCTL